MTDIQIQAWLDQEDAHVAAVIRRYGWLIQLVGSGECNMPGCDCDGEPSDGPPFAYTVGLFGLGHPELLIFGVPPGTAGAVLNDLGKRIRSGDDFVPGQLLASRTGRTASSPSTCPTPA
jgi:hypothetical protein